ncbi:DUF6456 domain-containing protein [Methylopila sp. M107]|uniref:DUF6456 domain-containing protein n=1 Tax=Methylopila sp. M107 TaxID=1101190 RepID=UPI000381FA2C|nr:DUF6456 domain-containing protein [Methylopila sp. M107]
MASISATKRKTSDRKPKRMSSKTQSLARLAAAGARGLADDQQGANWMLENDLAERRDGRLVATDAGRARAIREAGGPEPFLAQHRELGRRVLATGAGRESLLVDLDESPLAWLARRKNRDGRPLLSAVEVTAGERLRADFYRGQMSPRVTANWEASVSRGRRGGGGSVAEMTEAALAARMRVSRALDAVGPELSGALIDVCCFLKGVADVERERGWPARGAKLVLGLALTRLARHYGLMAEGTGGGRIVVWGAPDSRPTIDGV